MAPAISSNAPPPSDIIVIGSIGGTIPVSDAVKVSSHCATSVPVIDMVAEIVLTPLALS